MSALLTIPKKYLPPTIFSYFPPSHKQNINTVERAIQERNKLAEELERLNTDVMAQLRTSGVPVTANANKRQKLEVVASSASSAPSAASGPQHSLPAPDDSVGSHLSNDIKAEIPIYGNGLNLVPDIWNQLLTNYSNSSTSELS